MEKKIKVMEALLSCSNGLSKEEILWAESHLPNEKGNVASELGPNSVIRFNHDAKTITEAMGVSEDDFTNASELIVESLKNSPKVSMAVEKVIQEANKCPRFYEVLVLKAVNDCKSHFEEKAKHLGGLSDQLDKIKKMMEDLERLKKLKDDLDKGKSSE
jgi:hypothetical protein